MGDLSRRLAAWAQGLISPTPALRGRYESFKALLAADERSLMLIADLEELLSGMRLAGPERLRWLCGELAGEVGRMVARLNDMRPGGHPGLPQALARIRAELEARLAAPEPSGPGGGLGDPLVIPLSGAAAHPGLAGGKAANLCAAARAGARVPPGLVATTAAFRRFVDQGRLRARLERLLRQVDLSRPERLGPLCAGLRALVLAAPLPPDVEQALRRAATDPVLGGGLLAVRSSAVGEDGEASFAGQYESLLNVPPEGVASAWKHVVASKYSPRAVAYRVRQGLADLEAPMGVLLLPMIQALSAGVLHTSHERQGAEARCMALFALGGLADDLVSGLADAPAHLLARRLPPLVLDGGPAPRLPVQALRDLVLFGLVLEPTFGGPLELEWAVDRSCRAFLLQARALRQGAERSEHPAEQVRPDGPVMAEGLAVVSPGWGCGPVARLRPGEDPAMVPQGGVLVVASLTPALARCLDRVAAVAARIGSRASHFGSVAREARVPVVSGLESHLPEGLLVTVDADSGRVLRGCADDLRERSAQRADLDGGLGGGPAHPRLRERFEELSRLACRLGLTDPEAPEFSPEGCASLHDLVRYCHEMAVAEMAGLSGLGGGGEGRPGRGMDRARRLASALPLALYVLDLGGGLGTGPDDHPGYGPDGGPGRGDVRPERMASLPMRALWSGLAHPGEVWDKGPNVDWEEFDRISAGIFRMDSRTLGSLALVAEDYLHLLVRFGYHFAVVDSLCGPRAEANYVNFRFKGGGGTGDQRQLRLGIIEAVLGGLGFAVRLRGDMLDARLARREAAATARALEILGRLLVRTRRMDLGLAGEDQARELARGFLADCGCGMQGAEGCL